jgi:hypothetical protein
MNTKLFSLQVAVLAAALTCGAALRANTIPTTRTVSRTGASLAEFQPVAFRDSAEAGMLRRAYRILASGDHDYKGHRAKAMEAVKAAAELLGVDLHGDDKDKESQPLSDARLREAQGLITQVLGAAEVKDQKRIAKHLNVAVNHINAALSIK